MSLLPALHDGDPGPQACPRCKGKSVWQGWAEPNGDPNLHKYRCAQGHDVVLRFTIDFQQWDAILAGDKKRR